MTKHSSYMSQLPTTLKKLPKAAARGLRRYWAHSWWHKVVVVTVSIGLILLAGMYGIARWYITTSADKPLIMGASFIPAYAESLGVDPEETMDALINDVGIRHFRLVSYWNQAEPQQGTYDFSQLDWQFRKAEQADAKITLSLGLRQPRWPECHMPDWARQQDPAVWQQHLEAYMGKVVERYKDSPALDSYQVENEFFLKGFGNCEEIPGSMDRERLVREYKLVKALDPDHKVIINRSNNALGWPVGEPTPDEYGISIYKRVWDAQLTKRYLEYPFPAWYYGFVAGWQKLMTGQDMMIHELQAESWGPRGKHLNEISVTEADKSFSAERFAHRVEFGKATGMREMYLWGAEYWYSRMVVQDDPSLWNVAKDTFRNK
ncbi:MAG TPA: beta-galactosidase [Candidatus Saccharimonadales bacterium]|nr:beta-galactosidase [Candidatus Saccharimonadales bacterium]